LGIINRGLVLSLQEDLLFSKGGIKLKPASYPLLHQAAKIIRSCKNRIRIEGHADNSPVRGKRFSTNFELSAARALTVLRFFTEVEKIPERRLYAMGCGEYRPLFPNDTPEHRAKNRRVWIIFEGKPKRRQANQINIHGFDFRIGGV
jgi:chemotaxis protein MotB